MAKIEQRLFGATGMMFSTIGLGTWQLEAEQCCAAVALQRGLDAGANHIDTAELYGDGEVERIVGQAIRGRRQGLYLVSKVVPAHAAYAQTIAACERSLKNLRTDCLDVYLLHWREGKTPLEETFRAFDALLRDGKIRAFGVSNFSVKDLEEALRIAGPGKIACNQVLYHLQQRAVEFDVLPWCQKRDIAVVAYSPLGQGKLAANRRLAKLASARNVSPSQLALAFLVRQQGVFAIPKAAYAEHAADNVRSGALKLTDQDIALIDQAFPAKPKRRLPMI
jgi:diketogulonate reductase-like aldo/keto reductase